MKILIKQTDNGFEVCIRDEIGINHECFRFDTKAEVNAFEQGWRSCQRQSNRAIQSIPTCYEWQTR